MPEVAGGSATISENFLYNYTVKKKKNQKFVMWDKLKLNLYLSLHKMDIFTNRRGYAIS